MDRARRGRVGRVGDDLPRRRRPRPRLACSTGRRACSRGRPTSPPGPPSDDAVLVTCAYLLTDTQPWVEQSLFLAAIGEARDKGARALEAFAYRYREGTPSSERFLVHRTVFPHDFLADFGFRIIRSAGRIELARLDLGGLQPVEEGARDEGPAGRAGGVPARTGSRAAGRLVAAATTQQLRSRRPRAPRSGSRSAPRPCAGCRRRGRARVRSPRSDRDERGRRVPRPCRSRPRAPGSRRVGLLDGSARRRSASSGESGSAVSTQTASAWPTATGTRTHVALTGRSGSSRILRVSSRSLTSSSNSTPSKSQSMRRRCSSGVSARSASTAAVPAPETDWYVATRTRSSPAASRSGASTMVSGIVQQFGFATIPVFSRARPPLTSGTTSGIPSWSRKAADLSMHSAPAPPRRERAPGSGACPRRRSRRRGLPRRASPPSPPRRRGRPHVRRRIATRRTRGRAGTRARRGSRASRARRRPWRPRRRCGDHGRSSRQCTDAHPRRCRDDRAVRLALRPGDSSPRKDLRCERLPQ